MEIKSPIQDKKYSSSILDEMLFLQRIILQNKIGRGTNSVVFVVKLKRYNICFWLALVYAAWDIPKPHNMSSMFGSWLIGIPKEYKPLVLLGAAALCWSVWLYRKLWCLIIKKYFFSHVIYSTTHWLRSWAILQKPTLQDKLVAASHFLAQVAKDFFFARAQGCQSSLRIDRH